MAINRKFWSPSVTSQYRVCPIPFHMDTYRGCSYGCLFCFARDFIEFTRRGKSDESQRVQSYIEGNSPVGLSRWCNRVIGSDYNYSDAASVAFKERMPLKVGACSDPFPLCEYEEHVTHDCLQVLCGYDYPVQISTKNPEVFLSYADEFVGSNIALTVSCSFLDDDIASKIEVGAILPSRRFDAIRKLSEMGYKVSVRIQPFILPYSMDVAERYVQKLVEIGAYAFLTEGLKLRVIMSEREKSIYRRIGDVLGFDIIEDFRRKGAIEGGDRVYNSKRKREMLETYTRLSEKYGIKFFNADNLVDKCYGCGSECCGTDILHDYKVWGGCLRSHVFGDCDGKSSEHFGKCVVNFTRSETYRDKTIEQVCDEFREIELREIRRRDNISKHEQLSLFDIWK